MTEPNNYSKSTTTIITGSNTAAPELWLDVFIAGDSTDRRLFAEMFVQAACKGVSKPELADLVVFTGGADVNPALYGEEAHETTTYDPRRDEADIELYKYCLDNGVPMFGVCRGAQFLHVMNGGRLIQDLDNHNSAHRMWDIKQRRVLDISSVHHQACIKNEENGMEVIGVANKSSVRWFNPNSKTEGHATDIEAYFYRDTCCFGVQGHPEYRNYAEFRMWCFKYMDQLINENPDLELVKSGDAGSVRRMKPALIAQRPEKKLAANNVVTVN